PIVFDQESNSYQGGVYDEHKKLVAAAERGPLAFEHYINNPTAYTEQETNAEYLDKIAIYLGHYSQKFSSFLLETLARFWAIEQDLPVTKFIFQTLPDVETLDLGFSPAETCFNAFGIDSASILFISSPLKVKHLFVPSPLVSINDQAHPEQAAIFQKIFRFCSNHQTSSALHSKRVYLSRKKFNSDQCYERFAINEMVVETLFREFGFEVIHPELVQFSELVTILQRAEVIAGTSGAALHNAVFMRPDQMVITLGTPLEPQTAHLNQIMCEQMSKVRPIFVPFKGAVINEYHGTFVYHIPFLRQKLEALFENSSATINVHPAYLPNQQNAIALLGAHPSTTGALAKHLTLAGIFSGRITRIMQGQAYELWENQAVSTLNQILFSKNQPINRDVRLNHLIWDETAAYQRDTVIAQFEAQADIWMMKDPNLIHTLPFWQEGVSGLHIMGVFTNPMGVALSLYHLNQTPLIDGYKLGAEYNAKLLALHQTTPFPLFCGDLEEAGWLDSFTLLVEHLNNLVDQPLSPKKAIDLYVDDRIFFRNYQAAMPDKNDFPEAYALIKQAEMVYTQLLHLSGTLRPQQPVIPIRLGPAANSLQAAAMLRAGNLELQTLNGDAQMVARAFEKAAQSYSAATRLKPNEVGLRVKLGVALGEVGRIREAIEILDQIADSQHANVHLLFNLIVLHRKQKNDKAVARLCERALNLNPAHLEPPLLTFLAEAKLNLGQLEEAIRLYEKAFQADSTRGFIFSIIGDIYRTREDHLAAAEAYQ
ncbi:MAG: glycosyltransferase 61 family protein, partial [Chloroflexota bacterium]